MTIADPPPPGAQPAPLVPPAALTCPRCGGGLPTADATTCPSCGTPLGSALFGGTPPPLPERPERPSSDLAGDVTHPPAPADTPAPDDTPATADTPATTETPAPTDTPAETTATEVTATPAPAPAPAPASAPAPGPDDVAPVTAPPAAAPVRSGADRRSMPVIGGDPTVLRPMPQAAAPPAQDHGSCVDCGGPYDADGYCTRCGAGRPAPRDHLTAAPAPWLAGVCDRGIRHAENQDAMALRADPHHTRRAALVVCDGVTTAVRSAEASLAAADAAAAVLASSRAQGLGVASAREAALTARLEAAADAASDAVRDVTDTVTRERADRTSAGAGHGLDAETGASLPACTFVAAVVEEDLVVVGSVGDSRAYWLPDATSTGPDAGPAAAHAPMLLTEDDSFAQEQIRAGMDRAAAESGPQAHTITRWLGTDAPDHTPASRSLVPAGPGWLLLCSDGLWNYASEPEALADVVRRVTEQIGQQAAGDATGPAVEPLALAEGLIRWAKERGGHDNITAVLARVGVSPDPSRPADARDAELAQGRADVPDDVRDDVPTAATARPEHEDAVHG